MMSRMRWAGRGTHRGGMHTGFWVGYPKEDHYEDLDVGGRIILKLILEK
jgi:hypothetical protein